MRHEVLVRRVILRDHWRHPLLPHRDQMEAWASKVSCIGELVNPPDWSGLLREFKEIPGAELFKEYIEKTLELDQVKKDSWRQISSDVICIPYLPEVTRKQKELDFRLYLLKNLLSQIDR